MFVSMSLAAERPNVLLIYVDDLGYGDLACYGHPVIETPYLDGLAEAGVRLTQYYAPSALCSPSRAGILTGRTPYRTGIKSWIPHDSGIFLRKAEVTLAELFQDAGYATALIGKWHLNSDLGSSTEPQPLDHGFDYAFGNNAFQIPTNRNPVGIYRNGVALGEVEGFTAQLYADESIQWLEKRKESEESFFLFLSMNEPHTTIENPDAYNAMYSEYTDGEIVPIPSGGPIPVDKLEPRGPGEYYANISYMDHEIGRVLKALDRLGYAENTMVVFASDNGPVTSDWRKWWEVNAYGNTGGFRGRKHALYEGGIRVPAIVRFPGRFQSGYVSDEPVVGMDLFVTIAEQAGLDIPEDRVIDGVDVSQALERGEPLGERSFFWALPTDDGKDFVYRMGDWKLIYNSEMNPVELYNLGKDPLEFFNKIEEESEILKRLHAGFQKMYASITEDPLRPKFEDEDSAN